MDNPVRSLHDIVTIRNVDSNDFVFEYDKSKGNYPYTIKAGMIARFPRFLAEHAMRKLINKILSERRVKVNNEPARAELREQIFVEEEVFQQAPNQEESLRLKNEVDRLNKPSDLESVLNRHAPKQDTPSVTNAPTTPPVAPDTDDAPKKQEVFAGLEDEKKAKQAGFAGNTVDTTEETPPAVAPKVAPTRFQVLKYAEDKLGVTLDKKFMEKADKMSDEELIKELNYPTE